MARLYSINPPDLLNLELNRDIIKIGRLPDNDIVLNDILISRRHCEIRREGERWKIVDIGSLNGIYVNNLRVSEEFLASGDVIVIGNNQFVFEELSGAPKPILQGLDQELVKPVAELGNEIGISGDPLGVYQKINQAKEGKYFYTLYQIARALNSANSLQELIKLSLELVFQVINAERGVIMLLDEKGELQIKEAMVRGKSVEEKMDVMVSQTIARRAIAEKAGIITSDAKYDPRFRAGASVIAYNIRSALCVPIWDRDEIRGVIYLDNLMQSYAFNEDDMRLLTAIANQVAIALHQEELQEQMRQDAIFRANLARFHSPDVVNQIAQQVKLNQELKHQVSEREVTVLFADICGFTPLSEKMRPEELASLLNDYFNQMSEVIFKNKGTVDKFIGDAIMAIFGAPISYGNDAELAVFTAIEMLKKMEEFRASVSESKRFHIRIGINTGIVVAGYMGSSLRIEYTVLGDPVNVASRLQDLALPNSIYIGESTYNRVKGLFHIKDLGLLSVKGKTQKIHTYRVLGFQDQSKAPFANHMEPPELEN